MDCMASKLRRWAGAAAMLASVAWGQAPVVPVDHYGPPVCGVAKPGGRMSAEAARAEQALGAGNSRALLADEPMENFGIARYRLADYADCVGEGGCYWADLDAQFKRAEAALAAQVSAAKVGEKLALVMDIDETTLSSYCEWGPEDYGYISAMYNGWVVKPEAAVGIPGALRLFNEAKAAGVAVFFLTGRPGKQLAGSSAVDQKPGTVKNLEAAGFHGWAGLILRDGAENGIPTIAYKSEERGKIVDQGYRIVMSVGDQWSDLMGDPQAMVSVKLPNPFYFLP